MNKRFMKIYADYGSQIATLLKKDFVICDNDLQTLFYFKVKNV